MHAEVGERGVYAENMHPGKKWELGSYTVSEEEIVGFASRWDPQFFHVAADRAATEGYFGGVIASGIHTLAVYQRLSVLSRADNWHVIAGAGIDQLRFRRPVRPGDTLTGSTVVTEIHREMDRNRALITYTGELTNQHGEQVLTLTMSAYMRTQGT